MLILTLNSNLSSIPSFEFAGKSMTPYLFGKPGRHEGHLKRVAVGVKRVERVRTDDAQDRVHAPAELSANCKEKWKDESLRFHSLFSSFSSRYAFEFHSTKTKDDIP